MVGVPAQAQVSRQDDVARGQQLFQQQCALCHWVDKAGAGQGPNLGGVVGREAAATDFSYTEALRATKLTWTTAQLDRFLAAPTRAVPGTSMLIGVPDATARRDIIAFLATTSATPQSQRESSPDAVPAKPTTPSASRSNVFDDWSGDAAGAKRHITPADLPAPFSTPTVNNKPQVIDRPLAAKLHVPAGFTVQQFGPRLSGPRVVRTAPNGDLFVSESRAGRIRVLRAAPGAAQPSETKLFAASLDAPHGIAFYPLGPEPRWVYVANNNSVIRFPYRNGDLQPRGPPEIVVAKLSDTSGGHSTRDIAFSRDGTRMFVAVGSASNVAEDIQKKSPEEIRRWEAERGLGAAWGAEENRAAVLVFDPQGRSGRPFANGLRNCVGLAVHSMTADLWCAVNERDALGDDLVPDYVTRVREGAFYGWPWYYIGSHEDPRHAGARPDLAGKVTVPDVLIQPHSAALNIAFYDATAGAAVFPVEYRGDAYVALHGSWNRSSRTGYKVVRVRLRDGVPTGEYEDFLTGFVTDADHVWGRPVGVAVARDGALIVSEDGNGALWRIAGPAVH